LTTVVSDAVMTANLTGVPAVVLSGNQITYTLSGTNVGNNDANGVTVPSVALTGVFFYDVIALDPSSGNPLPVFGAPTGSPVGGTVLYLASGQSTAGSPETWNWSTTAAAGDIAVAYITAANIVAGQSYNFVYQVTVPAGMPAGVLNNTASLAYVDNDGGTPDPTLVVSNNAPVTIGTEPDVKIGPVGDAGAGTGPAYNDDVQSIPLASAATTVDFTNTIRNDGNAADQVNVILDGSSTVPGSWGVVFLQSDGITPLVDTGVDGIPDVGSLTQGDSVDIIVRMIIPGTQAAGGPFDAVVRGQSTNDPGVFNLTTDRIDAVASAGVDIGNYNGGAGTNDTPVTQATDPGTTADFPLDVINTSGGTDTYTLTSSLPAGWSATYYDDANGNGTLDGGETTPIASIGPIAALSELNVIAQVDVPAFEPAGSYPVTFTATSTNNGAISDAIADTVAVNAFAAVNFSPDLSGSSTESATVRYNHTLTNTGNVSDTFDLTYLSSQGWTYVFYDALNNPMTSATLNPSESVVIQAELTVPAGVTAGTVETATLTATGQGTAATDDAIDVTVIVAGDLDLVKSVAPPGDQVPGTELTYTLDYQNLGTDSLTTVTVLDPVPAFTQFKVGSAASGTPPASITLITPQYSNDGGASWVYAPVSGGGGAPANFDANVTNVRFVMTGTIPPGAGSTVGVSFVVRIIAE
jgi:uncharacterized repeat protein (TIGR01451 family)